MSTFRDGSGEIGEQISDCLVCGKKPNQGGFWMGAGCDITICSQDDCIEKVIQLALDAIYASERDIAQDLHNDNPCLQAKVVQLDWERAMARHRKFMAMIERIYWYKESIRLRNILFKAFPTPEEEPAE